MVTSQISSICADRCGTVSHLSMVSLKRSAFKDGAAWMSWCTNPRCLSFRQCNTSVLGQVFPSFFDVFSGTDVLSPTLCYFVEAREAAHSTGYAMHATLHFSLQFASRPALQPRFNSQVTRITNTVSFR
jgi:hypothetical protein